MFDFTGSYIDQYQLTMAQVYFLRGQRTHSAVFDYFFRKLPFNSGYAIFAGLADLLEVLENFHFDPIDIHFLQHKGLHPQFIHYLKNFRFNGNIYAFNEGDLIFPTCPIVSVEANIIEAQLIETLLLNILNFQTLIATKASRLRQITGDYTLVDYGLRRAQGPGGYYASRAAFIGGFDATSNVRAGRDYDIPISGTMAHSFIQSYDNEAQAFRDFSEIWPENCTLLVDTYNTIESGVPNAIKIGKEMELRGYHLQAIRLDSGNLADLAKKSRQMLDDAGLHYVKIIASDQLNEGKILSLKRENAPIDVFGVGTDLIVGLPDAALDGVYKLAFTCGKPCLKLSETVHKITLPYKKQAHRVLADEHHFLGADVITLAGETKLNEMYHPFENKEAIPIKNYKKESLLHQVMEHGHRLYSANNLKQLSQYSKMRLTKLPEEFKRTDNPEPYQIGLSNQLKTKRDQLIKQYRR